MTTKTCNICHVEKDVINFSIRNIKTQNIHNRCKDCTNKHASTYREENKEIIKKRQNEWYEEKGKIWKKNYESKNHDKIREYERKKYKTDPQYRMKKILRTRFKSTVNKKKIYKSVLKFIDMDLEVFLKWIEFQFDENMNWDNQGCYWDVDHVNPCDNFDLTNEEDVKKCYHWTNLRPLEKKENDRKNNIVDEHIIKEHKKVVKNFKVHLPENNPSIK